MENKNTFFNSILIAAVAVLAGLGLVFSMGVAVQSAVAPLGGYLQQIANSQQMIERKIAEKPAAPAVDLSQINARIAALESQVTQLKLAAANPQQAAPQAPPSEDMNKVYPLPLEGSFVYGDPNAPAKIVVFSDYQCPFCGRFYPAAKDAVKAFPGKASLVTKHYPLPFHPNARPAAKAAMAAGLQGKFAEMSDALYENAAALSDEKYKELAGKIGLNVPQFLKDLKDKDAEFEKKIQTDTALADKSDVRGTPTYFLNGKKNNARDLESWKREITAALGGK